MSLVKQVLIILFLPVLYILTGLIKSHYTSDKSFFIVWGSIVLLHWLNVVIVFYLLKQKQLSFKNIGFDIRNKKNLWFLLSYLIIVVTILFILQLKSVQSENHVLARRLFWIFACFTAGFCEELIWRGYSISSLLQNKMKPAVAILLSSLSFCLMHGTGIFTNPIYACFLFVFGVVFSIAFLYTKKLSPLMFIHMTYDLLFVLII